MHAHSMVGRAPARSAVPSKPVQTPPARPRLAGADTYRPRQQADTSEHRDSNFGVMLLTGMGRSGQHVYGGTVPRVVVADRRVRNRAARAARRITRARA